MSAPDPSAPVLVLDHVWKVFTLGSVAVEALRDVSFRVHEGEFVAITGPSGSGKTTLLEILGCLSRPTAGSYRLCGREVESMSPHQLAQMRREYIGFVFQSFNLLPRLTALENVELPLVYRRVSRPLRIDLARLALEEVGLGGRIRHFPSALSGGECQRVAIARALVTRPRFILADEPTGNLDSGTGSEILCLVDRLHASGKSILMVTHDPSIARRASVRLCIHDGRIEADASPGRSA